MTGKIMLSPYGTASLGLSAVRNQPADVELDSLLQQLCTTARLFNVDQEFVFWAWEVVRWHPGLAHDDKAALLLLALISLINLRRGSTRLPVGGVQGGACLKEFLDTLLAQTPDQPLTTSSF